jgi:hypothetical protein
MTTRPCCSPRISSAESLTRVSGMQNLLGTASSRSGCFRPGESLCCDNGAGHRPAFEDGVGSSAAVLGPGGAALPHLRRRGLRWVNDTGIRRTAGSLRSPDPGGCSLLWVGGAGGWFR